MTTGFGRNSRSTAHRSLGSVLIAGLGAGLLAGLGLTTSAAHAAVPQPGDVPWVTIGAAAQTKLGVRLTVTQPRQVGSSWHTSVTVCNASTTPMPVGPYTFSRTKGDWNTFWYTPSTAPTALANQLLAPAACASGALVSPGDPGQLAFHKILQGDTRIDILPATEWEGISKVREPQSPGTNWTHGDVTGDHVSDVHAVSGVTLLTYKTVSGPQLTAYRSENIGAGVNWMSKVPDLDKNGASDLLVRTDDGAMSYQRIMENGKRGFSSRVGSGWGGISLMAVVPRITPGANPWLIARASNGDLIRYQVSATGITGASRIGQNWNGISKLFSVGDFSGDGVGDVMAVGTNGLLYRYAMTNAGSIASVNVVGQNWNEMSRVFSPGDLNGDSRWDMVGVRKDGNLYYYANLGAGKWGNHRQIGSNWAGLKALA